MYGTSLDADAYHSLRGNAAWAAASSPDRESARLRASVSLDGMYQFRWPGVPTGGADQERAWPRTGATDYWGNAIANAVVPRQVEQATYELALYELATPGASTPVVVPSQQKVLTGVGSLRWTPLSKEVSLMDSSPVLLLVEHILSSIVRRKGFYPTATVV
jgi:hypothetical protein